MKLGIGTFAYAWAVGVPGYPSPRPMDARAFLQRAHGLGLRVAQYADNLPLDRLSLAERAALLSEAQSLDIQIEVGTRGIAPDHLRTYLEIAQHFHSPILRVVVDTAQHHPALDEIVSILRPLMPAFERAEVTLAIENHDRFKVRTLVSLLQQVGSTHIGICLDTVNSFGAGEGPEVVVAALGPYVVNLHVKDFTIRRHRHMLGFEVEGTPAGKGMLDVPWLLSELKAHGRSYNAILETWPPPEPGVQETINKENAWVQESVSYLRTLIQA